MPGKGPESCLKVSGKKKLFLHTRIEKESTANGGPWWGSGFKKKGGD